ncbi:MAG: NAD(+)/NADH kinase [Planctomycetia bacterium]|nr:NAD(+)/NADH kinase [Planctomycetia bacterium]
MKVFLLGYSKRKGVHETVARLREGIQKIAEIVVEDLTGAEDISKYSADIALVFGGDGSILRAVRQMGQRQIPVMAVNLGRLGFLADVAPNNLLSVLEAFQKQKQMLGEDWKNFSQKGAGCFSSGHSGQGSSWFTISEHVLLECTVKSVNAVQPVVTLAMNEVAVQNGVPFMMLEVKLFADEELVTTYSCDGLILSTPIGSTAHSLSAGGPILCHGLEAVVISPISPHTLTHRPVVDSVKRVYRFELTRSCQSAHVVVDGSVLCPLEMGDVIEVRESPIRFQRINVPMYSYYATLHKKLGWGGQMKYE